MRGDEPECHPTCTAFGDKFIIQTTYGPALPRELGGFKVILADPPWGDYRDKGIRGGTERHYRTLDSAALARFPVADLAADDAALFLWATYPLIQEALALIPRWGFTYKTLAFQWVKVSKTGAPRTGLGHWTRGNTEPCLLATRGKPERIARNVSQVIAEFAGDPEIIAAPLGRHSAKPPEVRDRIIRLLGPVPRVELFAREVVPGWAGWGDEYPEQTPGVRLLEAA
jgi:N6-adenosine-specific RNA methylase IME4